MKIISVKSNNYLPKIIKNFNLKTLRKNFKELPCIQEPLVLYQLRDEKDFKLDILDQHVNEEYVLPGRQKTLDIIDAFCYHI